MLYLSIIAITRLKERNAPKLTARYGGWTTSRHFIRLIKQKLYFREFSVASSLEIFWDYDDNCSSGAIEFI